jgi:hypothetical protein
MVNYALLIFIAQFTIYNSQIIIMKKLLLLLITFTLGSNCFAQLGEARHAHVNTAFAKTYDPRSDTIDILNYTINLRITDFTNRIIAGNTEVKFRIKQSSIQYLRLDLLALTVDSVTQNGIRLAHNHQNSTINIKLNTALNTNDSSVIKVHYKGTPSGDVTGWGGFYFQSGYAYNLGVGFGADPHVYGRVWFPCFDNFMERSTFDFNITTSDGKIAYCNGALVKDTLNLDGTRTRSWKLNNEIPTYLASVAVGNYVDYKVMYQGIASNYPIHLAILPSDSAKALENINVIKKALSIYENRFGPYRWNRVGYAMVPFNQGAMEHATNIAYPRSFMNSIGQYTSILVHELSHHWFGDLITCSSQEEMWLNEGWASYCEYAYDEGAEGYTSYISGLKTLHQSLLQFAGNKEGNINLNNVPHAYTYGDHVYLKGAVMAHNLRAYMGDSLFFNSLKTVLHQNSFKSITNDEFINGLSAASGLNLTDYLNDWIKQAGWANFRVDSFISIANGTNFTTTVYLKQSKYNNPNLYSNVPLDISFINKNQEVFNAKLVMNAATAHFSFSTPFKPEMVVLNMFDRLATAQASEQKNIKASSNYNFVLAKMNVTVSSNSDSSLLRIENHYAGPEGKYASNINRISPQRYWIVDGILSDAFKANARISYDGRVGVFTGNYYLDHLLNITQEDSILLLYRKNPSELWQEFPYYKLETGASKTNKYGNITIDSLLKGEYCLGIGASLKVGLKNKRNTERSKIEVYPNPGKDEIQLVQKNENLTNVIYSVEIIDVLGKQLYVEENVNLSSPHTLEIKNLAIGTYLIQLKKESELIQSIKFQKK